MEFAQNNSTKQRKGKNKNEDASWFEGNPQTIKPQSYFFQKEKDRLIFKIHAISERETNLTSRLSSTLCLQPDLQIPKTVLAKLDSLPVSKILPHGAKLSLIEIAIDSDLKKVHKKSLADRGNEIKKMVKALVKSKSLANNFSVEYKREDKYNEQDFWIFNRDDFSEIFSRSNSHIKKLSSGYYKLTRLAMKRAIGSGFIGSLYDLRQLSLVFETKNWDPKNSKTKYNSRRSYWSGQEEEKGPDLQSELEKPESTEETQAREALNRIIWECKNLKNLELLSLYFPKMEVIFFLRFLYRCIQKNNDLQQLRTDFLIRFDLVILPETPKGKTDLRTFAELIDGFLTCAQMLDLPFSLAIQATTQQGEIMLDDLSQETKHTVTKLSDDCFMFSKR